ncbi:hypothetical protein LT493_23760 [Streptomyces tricolor]|nr:hypothetical protein [Streptomyces tricolor]
MLVHRVVAGVLVLAAAAVLVFFSVRGGPPAPRPAEAPPAPPTRRPVRRPRSRAR